jgi:tetratricopeptide (TPR) repeat protein
VLVKALLYQSRLNVELARWDLAGSAIQKCQSLLRDLERTDCNTRHERAWLHVLLGHQSLPEANEAARHFEQALALQRVLGNEGQVAYCLVDFSGALQYLGKFDRARQCLEESLTLFRALGNQTGEGVSLSWLGYLSRCIGQRREAQRRYEEALALARAQGDRSRAADALMSLGSLANCHGDFGAEVGYLSESAALYRAVGSRVNRPGVLAQLGMAHWFCGEFDKAYEKIEQSLAIAEETGAPEPLLWATAWRAWLDAAAGRYNAAGSYARECISLYHSSGANYPVWLGTSQGVLGWVAVASKEYEKAIQTMRESIATFQKLDQWYIVPEQTAWSLAALGRAELGLGNRVEAQRHLTKGLELSVEIRAFIPLLHLMPVITLLLAEEDDASAKERTAKLQGLCISHPFLSRAQLFEDIAWREVRAATEGLPADVFAGSQERGRELDWWETAEALLDELRIGGRATTANPIGSV